jgi:hypothetical protein
VPRRRVTRFPSRILGIAACLAGAGMLLGHAVAQNAQVAQSAASPYDNNYGIMRPVLDGDPSNPPTFRRVPPRASDTSPVGKIPTFGTPPASGAGNTGFNSTNVKRPRPARPGQAAGNLGGPKPQTPLSVPPAAPAPIPPTPVLGAPSPASVAARAALSSTRIGGSAVAGGIPDPTGFEAPARRRPPADLDPFGPVGVRAGSFILRPAIEVTTGYDTNPSRAPAGSPPSALLLVAPELAVQSDWSRHEFDAMLRGSYSSVLQNSSLNRPSADARANARIDITRQDRIDLQGRFVLSTDYPGSPNVPADITKLPIYTDVGGTAGYGHTFNRLDVSLKGSIDRIDYQNSLLTDGSTSSNADRDYNQIGGQLRGIYEFNPGFKPFVTIDGFTRTHDLVADRAGFQRDSQAITPRVGAAIDWGGALKGEVAVGYTTQTYKDPALADLRGMVVDGSLVWTASGLTTATLTAQSFSNESTIPGVSGTLVQTYGFQVDHAFRRWLIGTARISDEKDTYVGSDRLDHRTIASLGVTYKMTRTVQIKGEARREWLHSTVANVDYTANVFLVGLRLQR